MSRLAKKEHLRFREAVLAEDLGFLEANKGVVMAHREIGVFALHRQKWEVFHLLWKWYSEELLTRTCSEEKPKIPLLVVTASYANYPERIALYETVRESFQSCPDIEPTFLLAASGSLWEGSSHATAYFRERMPQFVAIKNMLKRLGRNAFAEDTIVMICDDDDSLLHCPKELCIMAERPEVDGIRSLQAARLSEDGRNFLAGKEPDPDMLKMVTRFYPAINDLSGYTCRWGMFYDFMMESQITGFRVLVDLFDTTFMNWVDEQRTLVAQQPYIYRRPPTGVWGS